MKPGADLTDWMEPAPSAEEEARAAWLDDAVERLERGQSPGTTDSPLLETLRVLWEAGRLSEMTDPQTPDAFPGEFRFDRLLGRGSFGNVWLGHDLNLDRPVAVKTLHAPLARVALGVLRDEARRLSALRHPNLVRVHAWREGGDRTCYLIQEHMDGGSLADRVELEGPLPWASAVRYIADVAEALVEVHGQGMVHRDIKPANILWDRRRDEALLTDFGLAARLGDSSPRAGTPYYMPPEAFRGEKSVAADVYGLAASLFWLLTGSVPFPALTEEELLARIQRGLPADAPCGTGTPEVVENLIRAGLAADVGKRPSLSEFLSGLRGALNHLLADSLMSQESAPGPLRLGVSRAVGPAAFVPVAATHAPKPRVLRDMKRVPPAPPAVELHTGDRVRVEVESDATGNVVVFNVGPTGNLNLLQPPELITADRPLHVLDVEMTPPAGRERLVAVWSRRPLPLRLDELQSLVDTGAVSGSGPYRATRDMVRVRDAVGGLQPGDWRAVVLELNHR